MSTEPERWDNPNASRDGHLKGETYLVDKGYTQQLGIDYNKTWAGVMQLESVRKTAMIAAKLDLRLWHIYFVGAYLNSLIKENIYMKQPGSFIQPGFEDYVCKLVHTIYGTMQGEHDWYETLTKTYDKLGYISLCADPCVRYKKAEGGYMLTDTYMDDIFGASKTDERLKGRRMRWERSGRSRKWEGMSIFLVCESSKISMMI